MAADNRFDVIVAGVGGHGSAALYHLAKRGYRVLGLENFGIAHSHGSSHGLSRIIRLAYHEDPRYVPLLSRAYQLWDELQQQCDTDVIHITGGLDIASPALPQGFDNALATARLHRLDHEVLSASEVHRRFPGYSIPEGYQAVYQPQGGIIAPERSITAHARGAVKHGAVLREHESMLHWMADADMIGVTVTTAKGTYTASKLVLATGAWMPEVIPALEEVVTVERQVIAWFDVDDPKRFEDFPISIITDDLGCFYVFPPYDHPGLKIGLFNHFRQVARPDRLDTRITAEDEAVLRLAVARHFPHANGKMSKAVACMFSNTPDTAFILDHHPTAKQVVMCSACSGHGYKFSSVIGEILADLATTGGTRHDISMHRISPQRPGHKAFLQRLAPTSRL